MLLLLVIVFLNKRFRKLNNNVHYLYERSIILLQDPTGHKGILSCSNHFVTLCLHKRTAWEFSDRRRKLTVVRIVNVRNIAPPIVSEEVERSAVEQRAKVDREPAAGGTAMGGRRGGRGGGRGAVIADIPSHGVVDRGAGSHIRHVEGPSKGVDSSACGLVGEAEQSKDTVWDSRAYCNITAVVLM